MSDFERNSRPPVNRTSVFLQVGLGIVLTFLLHALVGVALALVSSLPARLKGSGALDFGSPLWSVVEATSNLALYWLMTVGLSQVLYVGPIAIVAWFVRRPIALGLGIGAALTFLLQSACYGLIILAAPNLH